MLSDVLSDSRIIRLVELALIEDTGHGDLTSDAVLSDSDLGKGDLLCKEDGIVAGLEVATLVFQHCHRSITVSPVVSDGSQIHRQQVIATVDGKAKGILHAERTALNFLQRMSGIATLTNKFVVAVAGTKAKVADTRKTVPGVRVLDKWAVRLGGGVNHRFGLDDMILIKENHVLAAGGIVKAMERCTRYVEKYGKVSSIEIEVRNLEELEQVLKRTGVQRIMLDNFSPSDMRRAVEMIDSRVEVEASGGVTLDNVRAIAETGVDYISIGALTHSVKALDISLELSHVSK